MSASIINTLKKVPIPLFGNALTATIFGTRKASTLARLAPWGIPLGGGALWFVWPAVDQTWKEEMGFGGSSSPVAQKEEKIELSEEALSKIEAAYVVGGDDRPLSEEEQNVVKAMAEGDYSALEKDWDEFQLRASNPNDDDDDDDDDDDEEEEEDDDDEGGASDDDGDEEEDDDDDDDDDE